MIRPNFTGRPCCYTGSRIAVDRTPQHLASKKRKLDKKIPSGGGYPGRHFSWHEIFTSKESVTKIGYRKPYVNAIEYNYTLILIKIVISFNGFFSFIYLNKITIFAVVYIRYIILFN